MKFSFVLSCFEVSSINASFSIGRCFFLHQKLRVFISLTQCFLFCFRTFLKSRLIPTLNGANNRIGSNNEDISGRVFPWECFNFFISTSAHLKAVISNRSNCNPSTHDSSVLGSTSTCLLRVADWFQVLWDFVCMCIVDACSLLQFKSLSQK